MPDMDPAAAANMAVNDHIEAEGMDAGSMPDPEPEPASGSNSLVDGLLETEPAASIHDYADMPEPAAHAMIGSVKFLNGVLGDDRQLGGGKPALINFLEAAMSYMTGGDNTDSKPQPEPQPDAEPEPPAGGVGGEITDE